jgi:hypothetical protein
VTSGPRRKCSWPLSEDARRAWFADVGRTHLNLILLAVWDPAGVSDVPDGADEYERYTVGAAAYLPNEDAAGLARELGRIEVELMGLSERAANVDRLDVAQRIVALASGSAWLWARKS